MTFYRNYILEETLVFWSWMYMIVMLVTIPGPYTNYFKIVLFLMLFHNAASVGKFKSLRIIQSVQWLTNVQLCHNIVCGTFAIFLLE